MQFQIPQFIDTEDKIVGPFTIKQFAYIGVAGAILFVLFPLMQLWVWMIFFVAIMGTALAMALVKINGQSLSRVVFAAISFYWSPQTYLWQTNAPKTQANLRAAVGEGFLEKIVSGMALKNAWHYVQTGSANSENQVAHSRPAAERYSIFRPITGEQRTARRVDYR